MDKIKETILGLKYIPNEDGIPILNEKVLIINETTQETKEEWRPVDGADVAEKKESSFSNRFKHDTFKPHRITSSKTSPICKKINLNIDYNKETNNADKVKFHVERSIRIDNLLRKFLKGSPEDINKNGFDFKGNSELRKALTILCDEMGGEMGQCIK